MNDHRRKEIKKKKKTKGVTKFMSDLTKPLLDFFLFFGIKPLLLQFDGNIEKNGNVKGTTFGLGPIIGLGFLALLRAQFKLGILGIGPVVFLTHNWPSPWLVSVWYGLIWIHLWALDLNEVRF